MDLNEINAILDNALATNAPSVAPTPTSAPTAGVAAPLTGMAYETKLADILNRRAALQKEIAGREQAISAMDTLGGLATGVGQGTTLGWGDEILAGLRSLIPGNTYEQTLAEQQAQLAKAREVAPIATMTGEIGSALTTPFAAARSVKALGGLGGLAGEVLTGAPRLAGQTALQTIVPSAVAGSLYGAGAAEPGERLGGALLGGALGVAVPAAIAGVGTGIGAAKQAITRQGIAPEAEIGAALLEAGVDPTQVAAGISKAKKSALGGLYSSAELTNDPYLSYLEQSIPTNIPWEKGTKLAREAELTAAREKLLTQYSTKRGINEADTGFYVKNVLRDEAERIQDEASKLYDKLPHRALTQTEEKSLRTVAQTARNQAFGIPKKTGKVVNGRPVKKRADEPSAIAKSLREFEEEQPFTTDQLIIKRSNINALINRYQAEQNAPAVRALTLIKNKITSFLEQVPGTQWQKANAAYREYAKRFLEGPLPNIGANTKLLEEDVLKKITSSQKAAEQFFNQTQGVPDALDAVQKQIISNVSEAFENGDAAALNELRKKQRIYNILFRNNPAVPETFEDFVTFSQDAKRAAKFANPARNSTTVDRLFPAVAPLLGQAVTPLEKRGEILKNIALGAGTGALAGSIGGPLAGALGALSGLARPILRAGRTQALGTSLADMLMNPEALQRGLKAGETVVPRLEAAEALRNTLSGIAPRFGGAATRGTMGLTGDATESPQSIAATAPEVPSITVDDIRRQMQELLGPAEAQAAVMPPEEVVKQRMIQRFPKASPEVREVLSGADELLQAIAYVESRGNPKARSPKGAIGLYQFVPGTAKSLGIDPNDPAQSLDGAKRYMDKLIGRFDSEQLALAAYNWGEGNVASAMKQVARAKKIDDWRKVPWSTLSEFKPRGSKDYLVPPETRQYVPKVLALRESYLTRG